MGQNVDKIVRSAIEKVVTKEAIRASVKLTVIDGEYTVDNKRTYYICERVCSELVKGLAAAAKTERDGVGVGYKGTERQLRYARDLVRQNGWPLFIVAEDADAGAVIDLCL
jgi:hypothetical protein